MANKNEHPALKFHTRFNRPKYPGTAPVGESRTKQSFREECNINNIVAKANKVGILPPETRQKLYANFAEVHEYKGAMDIIAQANSQFEELPALVRDRFKNDPALFLEFATNEANGEEMVKLGLAIVRPQEAPKEPQAEASPQKPAGGKKGSENEPTKA